MTTTVNQNINCSNINKSKEWQMEILMEKLRSKAGQYKTFPEISKSVRMVMLDKRFALDSVEKSQHQKCLDTLQNCIKVTSLQSMVERLESLTRQLGLKFTVGPSGVHLFISSDMFYLEVVLDPNESGSRVCDVKIHHEGKVEQQSCAELVDCLSRQDFADFMLQLEGLASIYQLNAEQKIKCKAFSALQSLETDLYTLAQLQTFMKEPFNLIHKSPVGILEKRKGGHPMKLTYFVSPYELIDSSREKAELLTIERVISKKLGYSATICIEGSTAHKLPVIPILVINEYNTPSYAPLSPQNSVVIPAYFFLRLSKPLPVCTVLARRIQSLTQLDCGDVSTAHPLLSLITQHTSNDRLDCANNRGLFVTLPDQHHCYFLTEGRGLQGIKITGIPFTHPAHVPSILSLLRQQALFNTVLSSCIRMSSKQDLESMIMFEITALSWQQISISLEHPIEESMATAEIDLSDISNITCKVFGPGSNGEPCETTSELATKVFQRCLSIPVTMRAIIKSWEEMNLCKKFTNGNENFSLPLGSEDPGGHNGNSDNPLNDFNAIETKIKQERRTGGNCEEENMSSDQGNFLNESMVGFPQFIESSNQVPTVKLSNLLSAPTSSGVEKSKKHKRKMNDDTWKSPKRKNTDDCEILVESSSSDSNSLSTATSHEAGSEIEMTTPTSVLGFHSDLEISGIDSSEMMNTDKTNSGDEIEEILSSTASSQKQKKSRENQKSPLFLDLPDKTLVPPSVSITPINSTTQNLNSVLTGMGLERRPGIEIIPISSATTTTLPSSITITPINTISKSFSDDRNKDKKSTKSRSDDKSKTEKKRKRKREEESMGPPNKVPSKQDPLSKPVSVSIKPPELSPLLGISVSSPSNIMRKFSPSPTHGRSLSSGKQSSPNSSGKSSSKTGSSGHHSLKQSSVSSPKHMTSDIASPKHHGTSPKHTGSSTGKPSMSALKSATNSPSSKSSDSLKIKSIGKESSNRDKERNKMSSSSSGLFSGNSNKIKSSSVKLKQLDLSNTSADLQGVSTGENLSSPTGMDLSKSSAQAQVRNRKGSLSAVIDKLKSAQHCGAEPDLSVTKNSNRDGRPSGSSTKLDSKSTNKASGDIKNSEYMVKPSSDGIKITINKTRTKDSSKSSSVSSGSTNKVSSSGSSSPKTHTGLKPGVNSGPASKKPQQLGLKLSTGSSMNAGNSSLYSKSTSSSGASGSYKVSMNKGITSPSKSLSKPLSSADRIKEGRPRPINKTDKSLFSAAKSEGRRSSPTILSRDETDGDFKFKMLTQHSKPDQSLSSHLMVEGLIKQTLDTKFQIPKLSARTSTSNDGSDNKKSSVSTVKMNSVFSESELNRVTDSSKISDLMSSKSNDGLKYSGKIFENNVDDKSTRNNLVNITNNSALMSTSSPLTITATGVKNTDIHVSSSASNRLSIDPVDSEKQRTKVDKETVSNSKLASYPYSTTIESINLSMKTHDTCANGKFITPPTKNIDDKKTYMDSGIKIPTSSQEAAEMLLDFSTAKSSLINAEHLNKTSMLPPVNCAHRNTPPSTASPSVSVHIVKSPVASPLIAPSPHSASPCITDDELMDEALVGIGK